MDKSSVLKSYGTIDTSWNEDKIKALLQDALDLAKDTKSSLLVMQDESGNIAITPNSRDLSDSGIVTCRTIYRDQSNRDGSEPSTELRDNVAYKSYTLEEMIPRVHDCLLRGIVEYGKIGFLSEGRWQLNGAFSDAKRLIKLHNKAFILGYRDDSCICVSPLSERSRFIDHLSCIVAKSGTWGISDTRSTKGRFDAGELQYAIIGQDLHGTPEPRLFRKDCKNKSCKKCQSKTARS